MGLGRAGGTVSEGPLPLFAYGTLVDPVFTGRLLGREIETFPATLLDFELLTVEGMPFATVFEAPGARVEGRLMRGLVAADYDRLDAYEGVGEGLYRRVVGRARVGSGEADVPAHVYVVTGKTLRRYGAL